MERCKTCRWWQQSWLDNEGDPNTVRDGGLCGSKRLVSGILIVDIDRAIQDRYEYVFPVGELGRDGVAMASYESVDLFTGPEFGCVHWQAKEGSDG